MTIGENSGHIISHHRGASSWDEGSASQPLTVPEGGVELEELRSSCEEWIPQIPLIQFQVWNRNSLKQ
jgi:hypothetical protein